MTLENALRLFLLMAPHVARIQRLWPRLKAGNLLEQLMRDFAGEMAFAPGEITQAFALCLGRDVEWVAQNATAKDLIEALPVLDRVNNFRELWQAAQAVINGE